MHIINVDQNHSGNGRFDLYENHPEYNRLHVGGYVWRMNCFPEEVNIIRVRLEKKGLDVEVSEVAFNVRGERMDHLKAVFVKQVGSKF